MILAMGNLIDTKGFDSLLRAFAEVRPELPDARCQIIGEGPREGHLKNLAADLGISDSVEWLGRQDRAQVSTALRSCAVFALPSTYEALGCVYLEAMASGKPVIGCRGQGIDEVIRNGINGWIVEPEDDRGLAHHLSRLLRDAALRQSTGLAARQTILNGFTLQHQAERLSLLYEECLS
jgi:glycosyltransferase involved in cell wall biosynthesis